MFSENNILSKFLGNRKKPEGSQSIPEKPRNVEATARRWNVDFGTGTKARPGKELEGRQNEDRNLYVNIPNLGQVVAVFDGVGATGRGAAIAADIAKGIVEAHALYLLSLKDLEAKKDGLKYVFSEIQKAIYVFLNTEKTNGNNYQTGAATTVSIALVYQSKEGKPSIITANIGDSPIYLHRPRHSKSNQVQKLYTDDHGKDTATKAVGYSDGSPGSNQLNQTVHISEPITIDSSGCVLVLSTDGVSEPLRLNNENPIPLYSSVQPLANKQVQIETGLSSRPATEIATVYLQQAQREMNTNKGFSDDATVAVLRIEPETSELSPNMIASEDERVQKLPDLTIDANSSFEAIFFNDIDSAGKPVLKALGMGTYNVLFSPISGVGRTPEVRIILGNGKQIPFVGPNLKRYFGLNKDKISWKK